MQFPHILMVLLVVFIWAFNIIAIKWGVTELPPLFLTMLRFVTVALLVVPFTRINREQLRSVALQAVTFGFMHFSLLFLGTQYTDAGTAAILVQLGTPFAMILAVIFLNERLKFLQIVGIILAFTGVVCLSGNPESRSWLAFSLLITSALGWAITNIIVKKAPPMHPLAMSGWMSFLAIPLVGGASLLFEQAQWASLMSASWKGWFAILYSAIASSILAYSLWYSLLNKYPVNKVIPYSLLSPVFAVILGVLIMGDVLSWYKVLGASLIIGGTFVAQVPIRHLLRLRK